MANDKFEVNKDVETVIREFYKNEKYIAACCIGPILLGKVLAPDVKLTLGSEGVYYFKLIK